MDGKLSGKELKYRREKHISKLYPINPANIGGFLTTNRVIQK
jgi:hypothetical protein